jgi:sarcosine oxidase gamma subunit
MFTNTYRADRSQTSAPTGERVMMTITDLAGTPQRLSAVEVSKRKVGSEILTAKSDDRLDPTCPINLYQGGCHNVAHV